MFSILTKLLQSLATLDFQSHYIYPLPPLLLYSQHFISPQHISIILHLLTPLSSYFPLLVSTNTTVHHMQIWTLPLYSPTLPILLSIGSSAQVTSFTLFRDTTPFDDQSFITWTIPLFILPVSLFIVYNYDHHLMALLTIYHLSTTFLCCTGKGDTSK